MKQTMRPYTLKTELCNYMPLPRCLLDLDLPSTALLLYVTLLDRATLSRKNGWVDDLGHVYVIYPVEKLAEALHISASAVKRHLSALDAAGLIRKDRPVANSVNRIFLAVPKTSLQQVKNAPGNAQFFHLRQPKFEP